MVALAGFGSISAITLSYANDRWFSTLNLLYISPGSRFQNYASRAVLIYPIGLTVIATSLVMVRLTTPVDFGVVNWPVLIVSLLLVNAGSWLSLSFWVFSLSSSGNG